MKFGISAFIILLIFSISTVSYAQTKEEVFAKIETLLNKAKGETIKSFSGEEKITRQVFSEKTVSCYKKGTSKYGSEWINRYSNVPWNDLFEHYIFSESSNDKLQMVKLKFKKNFLYEHFTSDENGDDDPLSSSYIELYAREKDKNELDKYFKLLYTFKEKKPESKLNEQIRKFNIGQTINWLTEKLKNNISGDLLDSDFKIVSIDACKIVITYKSLLDRYENVLPTAIKSVNKYGKFVYDTEIAGHRSVDGKMTYGKYSALYINNNDEEVLENIECALKHLAGFCK